MLLQPPLVILISSSSASASQQHGAHVLSSDVMASLAAMVILSSSGCSGRACWCVNGRGSEPFWMLWHFSWRSDQVSPSAAAPPASSSAEALALCLAPRTIQHRCACQLPGKLSSGLLPCPPCTGTALLLRLGRSHGTVTGRPSLSGTHRTLQRCCVPSLLHV